MKIETTIPRALHVRLEILKAIQALGAQDRDKRSRRRRDELASIRRELEQIALAVQQLRCDCDPRLRSYVIKYSPAQPRVPAGNPDGGQWTNEGGSWPSDSPSGSESNGASQPVQYPALETGADAAESEPGYQVATGPGRPGYPIDLPEQEQLGGHTIAQHVGKSQDYLLSLINDEEMAAQRHGDHAGGLREGSFSSLEAANKLVNSTIAANQGQVSLVTSGLSPREQLDAEFSSATGYEAYARTERSTPIIRDTHGVRVVIVPDRASARGYRVDTAFPINF